MRARWVNALVLCGVLAFVAPRLIALALHAVALAPLGLEALAGADASPRPAFSLRITLWRSR